MVFKFKVFSGGKVMFLFVEVKLIIKIITSIGIKIIWLVSAKSS